MRRRGNLRNCDHHAPGARRDRADSRANDTRGGLHQGRSSSSKARFREAQADCRETPISCPQWKLRWVSPRRHREFSRSLWSHPPVEHCSDRQAARFIMCFSATPKAIPPTAFRTSGCSEENRLTLSIIDGSCTCACAAICCTCSGDN